MKTNHNPELIAVQLETCHENHDGSAWYAYFDGVVPDGELDEDLLAEVFKAAKADGAPLGLEFDGYEEVPSILSKRMNLRRYYVGTGV